MKLSDVLRDLGADAYGIVALLLFFGTFLSIGWRTWSHERRTEYERASRLPLED